MAQEIRYYSVDDMELQRDPRSAVVADRTVRFSVDGQSWEIDLTEKNAGAFFDLVRPYQEAGRRVKGASRARPRGQRERSSRIREWAQGRGIEIKEKGRIPGPVVRQYELATGRAT